MSQHLADVLFVTRTWIARAAIIGAASPALALAQTQPMGQVRGVVLDSAGRPIESVEISALTVGRFARSDAGGRFSLNGLITGRNHVLARLLGWKALDTTVVIDPKVPLEVRLTLARVAQDLQAVHIVSQDECPTRTLEGFECRRRAGLGAFRDSAELASLKPFCEEHLIDGMAGLKVVPRLGCPGYEATTGWRCLKVLVDGLPLGFGSAPALMKDYVGVEFYADYSKAPEWYKQYAFDQYRVGVPTHQNGPGLDIIYRQPSLPGRDCSLVIYWTHFAPKLDATLDQSRTTTRFMKARRDSLMGVITDSTHSKLDSAGRKKP